MTQGKFRPENDYLAVLELMIEHCGGLGVEKQTSTRICAKTLGVSETVIGHLRKVAERTGGMTSRFEGGPKGKGGRKAYWTFTQDQNWIKAQAMEQYGVKLNAYDIEHKMPRDYRYNQKQRKQPLTADAPPPINGQPDPRPKPDAPPAEADVSPVEETQLSQQLRPLRKSEPEALIEAARQYMGREDFIKEELRRFADMGITIDESAIKVEKDPVLEAVSGLVEYIDSLNAREERLRNAVARAQSAPKGSNVRQADIDGLKSQNAALQQQVYDLRKSANDLQAEHRRQTQSKDRRIQQLEQELQRAATASLQNIAQAH